MPSVPSVSPRLALCGNTIAAILKEGTSTIWVILAATSYIAKAAGPMMLLSVSLSDILIKHRAQVGAQIQTCHN